MVSVVVTDSPSVDQSSGEVSEACMTIVKVSLVFFGVFGVFGNFNIILATYLRKSLRSKCGLLLAILAFCDMSCLLFELLSAVRIFTDSASMPRSSCFWSISGYLFILNVEIYMLMLVGFDRLLAISIPVKYMILPARYYIYIAVLPGILFSAALFTVGAVNLDNEMIPVCNPPLAYVDSVSAAWNFITMASCGCTVLIYVATYIMLYKIAPKLSSVMATQIQMQKILIKTLSINVIAYVFSSLLSAMIIFVMGKLNVSEGAINEAATYAVIPGLLSYSINYYVYFWRSSEYRRAFKSQLMCGYQNCQKTGLFINVTRFDASQVMAISRGPPRTTTS